ncbi:MAG: hypothetical protein KAT34_03815 [Candidatus Aminicenantes bacterium]|nr:hypothetical protein [Candidatus Aminicenantes bacterium]
MKKLTIYIFLTVLFFLSPNVGWSCVYMNDFEFSFQPPDNSAIADEMIDGSASFLQSYSAALMILYEREKAEKGFVSQENSSYYLDTAIAKLELSRNHYNKAITLASKTEYVQYRIDQLKNFDYNKFCSENKLNDILMEEVKQYLVKGDVIGIYRRNLEFVETAQSILYELRESLKTSEKPGISIYWEVIRSFSKTILFGNYATSAAKQAFGLD